MSQEFLDVLARHATANDRERLQATAQILRALAHDLALILSGVQDSADRNDLLARFGGSVRARLDEMQRPENASENGDSEKAARPPAPERTNLQSGKLPPELLEWARQQVNEEEIIAGLNEVRKTGGLEFSDFVHELEQAAND
jgi:hypothetical protein